MLKNWSMHSNSNAWRNSNEKGDDRTAPLQARSRATRNRILGALARLLGSKTFDQISVAELIEAAPCSMSSFYARFPTKEALLNAFHDRFFEVSTAHIDRALSRIASDKAAPEQRMQMLVEFVLRSYRDNRGLLRSLILHDRTHPDSGFSARRHAYKRNVLEAFLAIMRDENGRPVSPSARSSAAFALWLVVQAIEQIVLFDDPMMAPKPITEREVVEHLTAVLRRTVGIPDSNKKRWAGR